ncbi:MAG TPA: TRAP transporter small permease [Burkholderiales bacterium]|nr:TRAP transporter small permease [Burkholderiales bacterium]
MSGDLRKSGSDPDFWALTPIFLARALGAAAAFFLAATMLVTVADVFLRSFFDYPLRGVLELVELGLACTIFVALPAVFLRDEHLVVDVIDHLARAGVVRVLARVGAAVSLGVLVVMAWQMAPLARAMHEFGDVTSDLSIPRLYYWIPVLFGIVGSALATLIFLFRK